MSPEDLEILIEAIRRAEQVKPSQAAKREVFTKRGILGSSRDRFLTAILYEILKRQGMIDRAIVDIVGVEKPLILDPWLRASMRVALGITLFFNPTNKTMENLRKSVSKFLSRITHPFVSMYYWELYDKIAEYKFRPRDRGEELEFQYMLPRWFIDDMRRLLGDGEAEELFKALNERLPLSLRVNSLKASVQEVMDRLEKEGKKPYVSKVVPTIIKLNEPYDL
ncbi:MAG: Fmu (Sun) domain-containing protein, partial [Thermoprotei archaeon]